MLPRDEDDIPTQVSHVLCAACGQRSWQEVWGIPMCHGCAMAWSEAAPTDEYWYEAFPADKERYAEKRRWTAQWMKQKAAA